MSIIWIDVETTGLSAAKERLLEVACIITDDQLNEVARYEAVTGEAKFVDFAKVDPYVIDMHFKNGLWQESLLRGESRMVVDSDLFEFIMANGAEKSQLGGSTISFDRNFIEMHLPVTNTLLHYRNIDVTTFNEIAKRLWPSVHEARPRGTGSTHRAMPDIEGSLNVMRYYTKTLEPVGI